MLQTLVHAPAEVLGLAHELHGGADLLGVDVQLVIVHRLQVTDRAHHRAAMAHRLHHVARPRLALSVR